MTQQARVLMRELLDLEQIILKIYLADVYGS